MSPSHRLPIQHCLSLGRFILKLQITLTDIRCRIVSNCLLHSTSHSTHKLSYKLKYKYTSTSFLHIRDSNNLKRRGEESWTLYTASIMKQLGPRNPYQLTAKRCLCLPKEYQLPSPHPCTTECQHSDKTLNGSNHLM